MIKLYIKNKLRKKTNHSNIRKSYKHRLRSQTQNPLNYRFRLNKETQFSNNLIFISQSIFNKEQQIKKSMRILIEKKNIDNDESFLKNITNKRNGN